MVAGGIEGQFGHLSFGETAPTFLFVEEGESTESTVMFPAYSQVSYYGAEQESDDAPMIFFLVYAKKKRGFRAKEAQRFAFQLLHEDSPVDSTVITYSRRVLISCDTAILKFQKDKGTDGGKKKWSNVLSPRRDEATSKAKEEASEPEPVVEPAASHSIDDNNDDVYGFGGSPEASPAKTGQVAEQQPQEEAQEEEFTLIYEEDAMRRRDLLSSAVQTIDGLRFCGTWITNRKMFKTLVASQDEEPITLVVTRRGLCMLKPVDSMLSAYHWSEIRSFGASTLPASESTDAFVWMHKTVTYTVLLPVAEELETCCNNIINQALGGTFSSRPIPKYYPPSEYRPAKDSDGSVSGQMLAAKLDNKPPKWPEQAAKGEPWNKRHRQFLDAVIANDLHTVMEMAKDREKYNLDLDYVDINGISALYWAAIMGHTQIVSFLLPAGASVHSRDLTGGTPLHAAAYQGNQNIVSLLIKQGADVNAVNNAGQTPLHRASVSGLTGGIVVCVGLAISGCDVTAKDSRGNTALHLAALQGDANTCEALVQTDKGREVINEGNVSGRTPLHYAVLSGRKTCVEALLIVAADRFVKDGSGASAIDIARREVEDKEEREARAMAKGLVLTEGLQPAKDTLQLLLHWDPKKTGRLYRMKMMSTNEIQNSPSGRRKNTDLKAGLPVEPASPAKAAKLNMLKGMAGSSPSKSLGFDVSSMKQEHKEIQDLESDKGAVSDSLKEWENQAQALKERIANRELAEAEAKAKADAEAAAIAAEEADAAAAEAEIAAAKAAREKETADAAAAAAAAAKAEEEDDIDARMLLADDAAWTDSPVVTRRKARGNVDSDSDEDDGVRMWQAPKDGGGNVSESSKGGVMPKHMLFRRRPSQILTDAEKVMLSGSLTSMIDLKSEKGEKVNLVGGAEAFEESQEDIDTRLKAQREADERVEALRLRLQEERRARNLQRHLDEADRFEAMGKDRDAVEEYRLALEQGESELAEQRIDALETKLASEASRTLDALAEIEVAAALATEMSLGFGSLAGAKEGDKLKYGQLVAQENITAEELLRLAQGEGDQDDEWDDAEFQATLEKNLEAKEEKKPDLLNEIVKNTQKPKERLQINVATASEIASSDKIDSSDTWVQPSIDVAAATAVDETEKKTKKKKKKKKPQEPKAAIVEKKPEPEPEPEPEPVVAESNPGRKVSTTSSAGGDEGFDKKAYNAHVRQAKNFAAEENLAGALAEYQIALKIRPGHEGLMKKVRSLQKKLGKSPR